MLVIKRILAIYVKVAADNYTDFNLNRNKMVRNSVLTLLLDFICSIMSQMMNRFFPSTHCKSICQKYISERHRIQLNA
jgi:hypothetical protein